MDDYTNNTVQKIKRIFLINSEFSLYAFDITIELLHNNIQGVGGDLDKRTSPQTRRVVIIRVYAGLSELLFKQ